MAKIRKQINKMNQKLDNKTFKIGSNKEFRRQYTTTTK